LTNYSFFSQKLKKLLAIKEENQMTHTLRSVEFLLFMKRNFNIPTTLILWPKKHKKETILIQFLPACMKGDATDNGKLSIHRYWPQH
jgi:hypothetical protein